jgi:uncharacterized protein YcaQ
VRRLLVIASVAHSSPTLVTLKKETLSSSETSALARATWYSIPEDAILHSHHRENLISDITFLKLTSLHLIAFSLYTSVFSRTDIHSLHSIQRVNISLLEAKELFVISLEEYSYYGLVAQNNHTYSST